MEEDAEIAVGFGVVGLEGDKAVTFQEKPNVETGFINGGFFVLNPKVLELIEGDRTVWEREPLERLAREGQLMAYRHDSFWQCMDTLRDVRQLNGLWDQNCAPWAVWKRGVTT